VVFRQGKQAKTEADDRIAALVNLTQLTGSILQREVQAAGFWSSVPAQNKLKSELQELFLNDAPDGLPSLFSRRNALISRTLEWARENQGLLTG